MIADDCWWSIVVWKAMNLKFVWKIKGIQSHNNSIDSFWDILLSEVDSHYVIPDLFREKKQINMHWE